ncbi:MAG: ATP-binding cassette domain-containing protein [Myxococcota bacterium]|nr:ATP-binding cassette domain-containing protein [Myxococcota bacterium]
MKVEAQGVARRFGEREALRGLDFTVPAGRRVALVGPNGSGKSTLCRALVGLLRVEGRLLVDGLDPRRDRRALAPRIAYVPQQPPPLAAPVAEVVRAVAALRGIPEERVAETAARLDLPLARLGDTSMRGLSGGMRQKLVLALGLAADAGLLLLDEPTGSLDPESRERFAALFDERAGQGTVVLCSHRLEEIRQLVDHVIELREGHLLHEGPAADFLDASGRSVVELRVEDGAAEEWLQERGFRRGRSGWWVRGVPRGEKVALAREATATLGDALRDVVVRDLGLRDEAGGPRGGGRGR